MKQKAALLLAQINNKVIDLLISPKTTLPWLIASLPGGAWLLPLLAPIREAGSMLPQWWIQQSALGCHSRRDFGWRIGIAVQLFGVSGFVFTGLLLTEELMPWGILLSLTVLSLGRAFTSVFSKDIQADVIEKQRRGRFTGLVSSLSGALSIVFALLLIGDFFGENRRLINMGFVVVLVSVIVALLFSFSVQTSTEAKDKEATPSIFAQFSNNVLLRHMVLSRCFLLHAMLAIPFITVVMAQGAQLAIGWLVLASGLSALTASYLWGWMSDKRNILTLFVASCLCLVALLSIIWAVEALPHWLNFVLFYLLLVGYDGIRVGRKTLLLNVTNENNRLGFVGAGNTTVGIFLLLSGVLYSFLYSIKSQWMLWFLLIILATGILHLVKLNSLVKAQDSKK
ncbi:MFS transporter [Planctobacterium marinum]|uniref:MFS transporter n=1 Tax=Planctobacterium marinum TaxID=1631968 RepID=A0AA48KSE3_9ALTE|nr:MFS transporter [Planctobacterium marinum]